MKLKSTYSLIPIFVVATVIFIDYWNCRIFQVPLVLFAFISIAVYLILFYTVSLFRFFYRRVIIDVKPLLLVIVLGFTISFLDSRKDTDPILRAKSREMKFELVVRDSSHLDVYYGSIHRICKCSGTYSKIRDTIFVQGITKTIPRLSDKYLVTERHFVPVTGNGIEEDSSEYLVISEK